MNDKKEIKLKEDYKKQKLKTMEEDELWAAK